MKRAIPLFMALLLIVPVAKAAEVKPSEKQSEPQKLKGQIVYRNFIWGVSKADVRKYETVPFYKEEGDALYFILQPDIYRRMIRYDFKNDGLVGIKYEYVEYNPANTNTAIETSYKVQKKLTDLYGQPSKDETFWVGTRYKDYPEFWGRAMYLGDLRLKTTWNPPGAEIVLNTYFDRKTSQYELFYTIEKTEGKVIENTNKLDLLPTSPKPPENPPVIQP